MKRFNFAFALFSVSLSASCAYAGGNDAVRDSFVRSLGNVFEPRDSQPSAAEAGTLAAIGAGSPVEPDPVLASFERDLYREPVTHQAGSRDYTAGMLDVINVVLREKDSDQVGASFWRDLNHGIAVCEYLNSAQAGNTFSC